MSEVPLYTSTVRFEQIEGFCRKQAKGLRLENHSTLLESQPLYKSVNSFFILIIVRDKLGELTF